MKLRTIVYDPLKRNKTAFIADGTELTFGQLAQRANAVRAALPADCGQNVAVYLPDGAHFLAALHAVTAEGLTVFPLGAQLTASELAPLLAKAEVRTVITDRARADVFTALGSILNVIVCDELPAVGCDLPPVCVSENEVMVLLGTSGTTDNIKIVRLTEKNVAASMWSYVDKIDFSAPETVSYALGTPYASAYGILIVFTCAFRAFPLVLLRENFTLGALYRTIERHKVTHFEGGAAVALLMAQTAGRPIPYDISSLRHAGFGGSKVTAETFRTLRRAYPEVGFFAGYGMTEAAPMIARPDKFVPEGKLGSVGTPNRGGTILIETERGKTNAPFVKGEIVVGGDNIMVGYYGNEEATREVIENGLLHTGDIGWLDEDGWLYICGRKKNVIIVRGFNVYAEEVEACIIDSKLAGDCAVYGQSDGENETVCADVVPARRSVTAADIGAYCAAHLAPYKRPRVVNIVETIGKTATGKNLKRKAGK